MGWLNNLPANLLGEGRNYLRDLADIADQGVAEFVSSGEPQSINGRVAQAAQRQVCRSWARGRENFSQRQSDYTADICEPYLKSIDEWPGQPTVGQPLAGGQCPVLYDVTFTCVGRRTRTPAGGGGELVAGIVTPQTERALGPIRPWTVSQGDTGPNYLLQGANRLIEEVGFNNTNTQGFFEGPWRVTTTLSVVRVDGQPDNCGGDSGPYLPPRRYPDLPPIGPRPPRTPPGFPDIDIDVDVKPDGTIDVDIDGEIRPYIGPDGGGGDAPPGTPGDQGEPGSTSDPGEGGEEEGSDPNRFLVGVLVTITDPGPVTQTRILGNTEIFVAPYAVYMGGDAGLELSKSSEFVPESAFHYAPKDANRFLVVLRNRVRATITPYWREQEEE